MMNTAEYRWRELFLAVLTELDSEKFQARLIVADDAVFNRLLDLESKIGMDEERIALEDTMQDIRLLKTNCYHFII
jgi:hypothetical protein